MKKRSPDTYVLLGTDQPAYQEHDSEAYVRLALKKRASADCNYKWVNLNHQKKGT